MMAGCPILQPKARIVSLLRASSKMQTAKVMDETTGKIEHDIPQQRNILNPWIDGMGELTKEFVEGGISGFKVSANDRDAIVEIKRMADRKEFDILAIYMSDRLGRIAEETPLIVSYLNARGIKVISYAEGEIKSDTHQDKLMTYIRFWQAEGESLKTQQRVRDAGEASVRQGKWRGGAAPFGYQMISRGTLNFKGRPIFDIEQDPEEAMLVQMIFRLYTRENYGAKKIARLMNDTGKKTHKGGQWATTTVMTILKNKIYIGFYELGKWSQIRVVSPRMENLQIIDDQLYYETQEVIKKNTTSYLLKDTRQQRPTRHGQLLLTGLTFCGDCGLKVSSHSHRHARQRASGETWYYERHAYRCRSYSLPQSGRESCERRSIMAQQLDTLIIHDAKNFVTELDKEHLLTTFEDRVQEQEQGYEDRIRKTANEKAQREKEIQRLKDEVVKALMGESQLDQGLLNEMIVTKTNEITDLDHKHEESRLALAEYQDKMMHSRTMAEEITGWEERFDAQDDMSKKAMLIRLIECITIYGDKIEVRYNVRLDVLGDNGEEFDSEPSGDYNRECAEGALFSTGLVKGSTTPKYTNPNLLLALKQRRWITKGR